MKKLVYAKAEEKTLIAMIGAIKGLCQCLKGEDLERPGINKAIQDFQNTMHDESAFSVFLKLSLTDEDRHNRDVLNKAVKTIIDNQTELNLCQQKQDKTAT